MLRALARTAIDDPSRSYLASCRLPTKTCERTCARCLAAAIDGANLPNFFFWCHQIDREMLFLFNLIRMGVDGSFLVQHCCCCCRRLTDYCFGTFRFSQNSRKLFFPFFRGMCLQAALYISFVAWTAHVSRGRPPWVPNHETNHHGGHLHISRYNNHQDCKGCKLVHISYKSNVRERVSTNAFIGHVHDPGTVMLRSTIITTILLGPLIIS